MAGRYDRFIAFCWGLESLQWRPIYERLIWPSAVTAKEIAIVAKKEKSIRPELLAISLLHTVADAVAVASVQLKLLAV